MPWSIPGSRFCAARTTSALIFFIGVQHCRTTAAAKQHDGGSAKALKAALRRQAELDRNEIILQNIDKVVFKMTNAVLEIVG